MSFGVALLTITVGVATCYGLTLCLFLAVFGLAGSYMLRPLIGWARAAWLACCGYHVSCRDVT